jgi:fibro-slime domain-containing protein
LLEQGFACETDEAAAQDSLNLLVTYRDFISFPAGGGTQHADFEIFEGSDVTPLLTQLMLDGEGKPTLDGRCSDENPASQTDAALCPFGQMMTTAASFSNWYRDAPGVNVSVPGTLLLQRQADGSYLHDSGNAGFYPIDAQGQIAAGAEESFRADPNVNDGQLHNFGFTTEVRYFFQYNGGESLSFSGDDDLWIFINHTLALDVGGLHSRLPRTLDLDQRAADLGLELSGLYEIALFHAERHSAGSNFQLTLTGFAPSRSQCLPDCGDGIVAGDEECDFGLGRNLGGYNGCTGLCQNGLACADEIIQPEFGEECDDGNLIDGDGCSSTCIAIVE